MKYKVGDIVLVKSRAGEAIPNIHVKLLERVIEKPEKVNKTNWPGYSGWNATMVDQDEIDMLRKEWNIPSTKVNVDLTFVYDEDIIRKKKVERKEAILAK